MQLVTRIDANRLGHKNGDVAYANAGRRIVNWRLTHDADKKPRVGKAKAMSQIRFAELADVSVGCLQGLETGTRATRKENLVAIAKVLGLTEEQLTSDDPDQAPAAVPDPRGIGLRDEDYTIAHLFHDARTEVRVRVKTELERDAATNDATSAPSVTDRRTGGDRRHLAHDRAATDMETVRHMDQVHQNAVHDFIEAMDAPPPTSPPVRKRKAE